MYIRSFLMIDVVVSKERYSMALNHKKDENYIYE